MCALMSYDDLTADNRVRMYNQIVEVWRGFDIVAVGDLDLRLDSFRVLFAYHSGRIENPDITYHDTREVFENGRVLAFSGDPRTVFELQNQKNAYRFLIPKIIAREALTTSLLLETHAILCAGTYDERRFLSRGERPGAFKLHDYVIGRAEAGSHPDDVKGDITELLEELAIFEGEGILTAAAYFHARLENIHPFADGNGRTGRLLLNYFLMMHNHPPVIIYNEDKSQYYSALEQYDTDEVVEPLVCFLQIQVIKTWQRYLLPI
jgi:Fic family protein